MTRASDDRPLIAHVLYRFAMGGLENGVANVVNGLSERFRHAIVSLTDITDFRRRIHAEGVEYVALNKPPGHLVRLYPRLHALFRELRPSIVHTRNLAALEAAVPAWSAGVAVRLHGEHGRDMSDLDGTSRRYRLLRRVYRPFVSGYVAMSQDLERYLRDAIGARQVTQIYNGVDTSRFSPAPGGRAPLAGSPFNDPRLWLVGTAARLTGIKDHVTLARAFVTAVRSDDPEGRMRLVIAGDGPVRSEIEAVLREAGLADRAWLPGERSDVPDFMRALDCFVLPSLAEGISNTILEAMASGLPVIATRVGGNVELVDDGVTGMLVPPASPAELARALVRYRRDPALAAAHGAAGRVAAVERFGLDRMLKDYGALYDACLEGRRARGATAAHPVATR